MPTLRSALYPFGLVGPLLYILRFWLQWRASERAQKSIVPPVFWQISMLAGAVMIAHYTLQIHLPQAIVQWINAYMATRNYQLTSGALPRPPAQHALFHIARLGFGLILLIAIFVLLRWLLGPPELLTLQYWISPPGRSEQLSSPLSPALHLFGMLGTVLLALRFWIQWFLAENDGSATELGLYFWLLSLAGSVILLVYSALMRDWVTGLNPCIGILLYARNIFIIGQKYLRGA